MSKTKKTPATNSKGRGVKIDERIKAKAQIMLAYGDTVSYVSSELGLKPSTVYTWEKALKNDKEFANFRNNILKERKDAYLLEACECLGLTLKILHKKMKNAAICEEKRGELIERVLLDKRKNNLSDTEFKKELGVLTPEPIGDIVRAFSILTEKVALLNGEATQNINHSGAVKFEDL